MMESADAIDVYRHDHASDEDISVNEDDYLVGDDTRSTSAADSDSDNEVITLVDLRHPMTLA